MTKNILLLAFIVNFISNCFSQEEDYKREINDTIPESFVINQRELRDQLYSNFPSYTKKWEYDRLSYRLADLQSYFVSEYLSSGEIYNNWPSLTSYLNEIVEKVRPTELENDTTIKAYLTRDPSFNAFMIGTGHLFFNIGILEHGLSVSLTFSFSIST